MNQSAQARDFAERAIDTHRASDAAAQRRDIFFSFRPQPTTPAIRLYMPRPDDVAPQPRAMPMTLSPPTTSIRRNLPRDTDARHAHAFAVKFEFLSPDAHIVAHTRAPIS